MDKVVQTTLPMDTFTRLSERAKKDGKPLKAVVKEAIEAFLEEPWPAWEDDPLSRFVGAASGGPGNLSRMKDWARQGKHGRVR